MNRLQARGQGHGLFDSVHPLRHVVGWRPEGCDYLPTIPRSYTFLSALSLLFTLLALCQLNDQNKRRGQTA